MTALIIGIAVVALVIAIAMMRKKRGG